MDDVHGKPEVTIAVIREFESSRLESALLAAAYEHVVPILSRPTHGRTEGDPVAGEQNAASALRMDVEDSFALGGLVG